MGHHAAAASQEDWACCTGFRLHLAASAQHNFPQWLINQTFNGAASAVTETAAVFLSREQELESLPIRQRLS